MPLRDYMSSEEQNDFLQIPFIAKTAVKILDEWGKRRNLTKEESKKLKYVITYAKQFYTDVMKRMADSNRVKYAKRLDKFQFRFIDDYQLQKIMKESDKAMAHVCLNRDEWDKWCETIMNIECNGCTKHWGSCPLHNMFYEHFTPEPTGYKLVNCRYAYENSKSKPKEDWKNENKE